MTARPSRHKTTYFASGNAELRQEILRLFAVRFKSIADAPW